MYVSFQIGSSVYDQKLSSFWAKFLTKEWNQNPKHLSREEWLEAEYGIVIDRVENDKILGFLVPDKLRTFVELQSTQFS